MKTISSPKAYFIKWKLSFEKVYYTYNMKIPKAYYTYDDKTCEFTCNAIEYWWWSTASITGLLNNRFIQISSWSQITFNFRSSVKREFKYYLPEVFKAKDPKMYALITVQHLYIYISIKKDQEPKEPRNILQWTSSQDTTKGYRLPTRPPNGKYTGKKTCASAANVI